ncbi:MAG: cyclic nucleotide-binding domain-containing protein [Deltaproteobacteria bacterium]|nr:cyclic nucleotide-binding domain-containing protein [Deltaproteobacteria bacterium]
MKESKYIDENIEIVQSLKKLPIIDSLEDANVKGLMKLCKVVEYEDGETIFEEDGFDQHIFFLLAGRARIVKKGIEVSVLERCGDVFGEMGIIDAKPRSASVYAASKTVCLKMDVSFIDRLADKERELCLYVVYRVFTEILSNRLRQTTEDLIKAREENERLKEETEL